MKKSFLITEDLANGYDINMKKNKLKKNLQNENKQRKR